MKLDYEDSNCCSGCAGSRIVGALCKRYYGVTSYGMSSTDERTCGLRVFVNALVQWARNDEEAQAAYALGGAAALEPYLIARWEKAMGPPPKKRKRAAPR